MWRKDKYYVLHGMTLNWWFTNLFMYFALIKIKLVKQVEQL